MEYDPDALEKTIAKGEAGYTDYQQVYKAFRQATNADAVITLGFDCIARRLEKNAADKSFSAPFSLAIELSPIFYKMALVADPAKRAEIEKAAREIADQIVKAGRDSSEQKSLGLYRQMSCAPLGISSF